MKSITIELDQDPENQVLKEFELECLATINGKHYYDCLVNVFNILQKYDKKLQLDTSGQRILDDIRKKCAVNFRGIYHDV